MDPYDIAHDTILLRIIGCKQEKQESLKQQMNFQRVSGSLQSCKEGWRVRLGQERAMLTLTGVLPVSHQRTQGTWISSPLSRLLGRRWGPRGQVLTD